MEKTDIKSLTPEELVSLVKEFGEPKFRAKQLLNGFSRALKISMK